MPSFHVQVPHQLGRDAARQRLRRFLELAREHYKNQVGDMQGEWEGDRLNFAITTLGFQINCDLSVQDESVQLEGSLPLAAALFRGKIEKSVAAQLERVLS